MQSIGLREDHPHHSLDQDDSRDAYPPLCDGSADLGDVDLPHAEIALLVADASCRLDVQMKYAIGVFVFVPACPSFETRT